MKTIILIVLLTFSVTTYAQDLKTCTVLSDLAGAIMKYRQDNVDVVKLYDVANSRPDAELQEFMRSTINLAYRQPGYSTDKYQAEAIVKFKNQFFLDCMKGVE